MANARAIWTGSIGFGMALVPVKLYTATREQEVKFKRWHAPTKSYPKQVQMVGEEIVPLSDMTSVFDTGKNLVEITPDELSMVAPITNRHMKVMEFVPKASVDPIYVEKTYFLAPDGTSETVEFAYTLFAKALEIKDAAAIVRVTMRTKEHLAMIYVNRGTLCLSTMFYDAEVVADNGVYIDLQDVAQEHVELAVSLVEAYSSDRFDAAKYKDTHVMRILELIAKKENGIQAESTDYLQIPPPSNILEVLRTQLEEMVAA